MVYQETHIRIGPAFIVALNNKIVPQFHHLFDFKKLCLHNAQYLCVYVRVMNHITIFIFSMLELFHINLIAKDWSEERGFGITLTYWTTRARIG